jgi:phosphate transport system substrate-binding protein
MDMRLIVSLCMTAFLVLAITGCSGCRKGGAGQTAIIKIDGSSTVYLASEAVAEEFKEAKEREGHDVRVTVGISGTGGGFKKFCRGETDISDASRPILKEEMAEAKKNGIEYIELPVCFDAMTVAVNPRNDWCRSMTIAELKKMWEPAAQGTITHWNQIRPEWPKEKFTLYGAGSDSGTFDYFTEAVVGKAKSSRGDYTASEDDNVLVQGIEGNKYGLGYVPYGYYVAQKSKMKAVAIQWDKNTVKEPVLPSQETVLNGTYNPLSRPLFIYVNKKSAARPEVKEFVEFYLTKGPDLVREVKYVPLPAKAYEMGLERFRKLETGTGFGGEQEFSLRVEEILKRTPKH